MDQTVKQSNELVSVIIPVYNAGPYVAETLDSVLKQSYQNLEVIVVNDGSTDNSEEVLNDYSDRVKVIHIENQGVSHARNYAVQHASGEWLAFVDADDLWHKDKVAQQLANMDGLAWSHCNSFYIGESQSGDVKRSDLSQQAGGEIFEQLILENFITTSTVMIKRALFQQYGGFDENLEALEDWKLWLQIAKDKHPIAYESAPLAEYRVYDGSTSRRARKMLPLHQGLISEVFQTAIEDPNSSQLKNLALANSYQVCSYIAEDSKDYSYSLYCAWLAFKLKPYSSDRIKRLLRTLLNIVKG